MERTTTGNEDIASTERGERTAALLALGFLVASLLLGLLVPVYTDEVAWRFMARAAFDGGVDRGVGDTCGANTIIAPPAFILPLRHISAFLNSTFADPMFIRLAGVATALLWVGLFWILAGRIATGGATADRLRAIGLSLLGLGVTPLLLVWSRPEQAILLAVTLAIIIASRRWLRRDTEEETILHAGLASAAVLLLALIAIGYHLKGIVYLPIFAACILIASRGRAALIPRIFSVALLAVLAFIAFQYWLTRFQCPGDPVLAAKLAKENVASLLFDSSGGPLFSRLTISDFGSISPVGYVQQVLPAPSYMSNWLPRDAIGDTAAGIWSAPVAFGWLLASLITLLCLFSAARHALRTRRIDARLVAALVLLTVMLAWGTSQLNKNSYESALVLPAAVMALLLAIEAPRPAGWLNRPIGKLHLVLLPIAIVSQLALAVTYGPALWRNSSQPGYIWPQFFSISPYGYSRLAIASAGRKCGIDPAAKPRGVLVDDLTYFTYMHSWRPLHRLGTLDVWNGSIRDPVAYLRSRRSDGAVIACAYLPEHMRAQAIQTGHFCCIGLGGKAQGTR